MAIHRVVREVEAGAYRLGGRWPGGARAALPPFPDLVLDLDELWPPAGAPA
jgi:hypothetical protein